MKEHWQVMEIRNVVGFFCDLRINRGTVPEGYYFYELRDDCSDGMPCQYKSGIMVDFFGTFISKEALPYVNDGFFEPSDWGFLDGIPGTIEELETRKTVLCTKQPMYLLHRELDMETTEMAVTLYSESQLIDYINMDDCHNENYIIFDVSEYGCIKRLQYKGWQPDNLIELVDEAGNIVVSAYGTDH